MFFVASGTQAAHLGGSRGQRHRYGATFLAALGLGVLNRQRIRNIYGLPHKTPCPQRTHTGLVPKSGIYMYLQIAMDCHDLSWLIMISCD